MRIARAEVGLFVHFKKRYQDNITDVSREKSRQIFSPVVTPQKAKEGKETEFVQPPPKTQNLSVKAEGCEKEVGGQ